MTKFKSPLLSLGASGTLSDAITFQRAHKTDFAREKPIPAYRRTLPQVYQRWLYEDYAYLWRQQSQATRLLYASKGYPFHLTAYQMWMKEHLRDLSDIEGYWKLDHPTASLLVDSSRHNVPLTRVGASPATGVIDQCCYLDGLNDYLQANVNDRTFTQLTLLVWLKSPGFTGSYRHHFRWRYDAPNYGSYGYFHSTADYMLWALSCTVASGGAERDGVITYTPNTWLLTGYKWDGVNMYGIKNNTFTLFGALAGIVAPLAPLRWGSRYDGAYPWDGYIDQIILLNRAISQDELNRFNERRYPE